MTAFDTFLIVDWSGGNDRGSAPKPDAIWVCVARNGVAEDPIYLRNRLVAEDWLGTFIETELQAGRSVFAGFDFPFGYPAGFCEKVTAQSDPLVLWDWLETRIEDAPKTNNRFDVAAEINRMFDGIGPFWGNGLKRDIADLPRKGRLRTATPFPEKRTAEQQAKGAFTLWQLSGVGSVGSQALMGLPVLSRLRKRFAPQVSVWPFETLVAPIAFVEIWPSLSVGRAPDYWIKDAWQVFDLARRLSAMTPDVLQRILDVPRQSEGWIFGLGHEAALRYDMATDLPVPAGSSLAPRDRKDAR